MAMGGMKKRRSVATEGGGDGGGAKGWFERGRDKARRRIKRDAARQKQMFQQNSVRYLWIKDGEEATVRFLDVEPVTFFEHSLRVGGRFEEKTCSGEDDCLACKRGIPRRWKAAYNVIDRREFKGKDGTVYVDTVKIYKVGKQVFEQIDRVDRKYDLEDCEISIERSGGGLDTTYQLLPEPSSELSQEDKLKDKIDLVKALQPPTQKQLEVWLGAADDDEDEYDFDGSDED
jgi:hypothetical protein